MSSVRFSDIKYLDWASWRALWESCTEGAIATMYSNLVSDLNAGYDLFGKSITSQKDAIDYRTLKYKRERAKLDGMNDERAEHWCFESLRKSGYIS